MKSVLSLVVVAAAFAGLVEARQSSARAEAEKLDLAAIGRVREEGLARSQVMDHIFWLADVYGPRLTGSPGIQQASEWAMNKFKEWGLSNVHQERWKFGKGWSLVRFNAQPRRAAGAADHRLSPILVPRHQRPGHRRRRARADRERDRLCEVSRQAHGQDRSHAAGASRADARRTDRPAHGRRSGRPKP